MVLTYLNKRQHKKGINAGLLHSCHAPPWTCIFCSSRYPYQQVRKTKHRLSLVLYSSLGLKLKVIHMLIGSTILDFGVTVVAVYRNMIT